MSANRSQVRRREEKEQRREEIVDAAEIVFQRQGYATAKMEDVARQARVSRALVYLYFRNKEELYFAICVRALHLIRERFVAAAAAAPSGLEKIHAIGRAYVRFAGDCPGYFHALTHLESHKPTEVAPDSIERAALDAGKAVHGVTIAALEQGMRDGSIRKDAGDPLMLALSLWAFSHGAIQLSISKKNLFADVGVDLADFTQAALRFGLRGLLPPTDLVPEPPSDARVRAPSPPRARTPRSRR
ncbi:MAG TPA: TetR/AcrR family transcriptional regulator [Solimonas sp.]